MQFTSLRTIQPSSRLKFGRAVQLQEMRSVDITQVDRSTLVDIRNIHILLIDDALAVVLVVVLSGQSDIKPYFPKRLHTGACCSGFACTGHDTSFTLTLRCQPYRRCKTTWNKSAIRTAFSAVIRRSKSALLPYAAPPLSCGLSLSRCSAGPEVGEHGG